MNIFLDYSYTKNSSFIKFNMKHIILFFIGFIFMVIGCTFSILYFNLFVFGYSFLEYILFLLQRGECYLFILGSSLVYISLIRKGRHS